MIRNPEKLQKLWTDRGTILGAESLCKKRFQEINSILTEWEEKEHEVLQIPKNYATPAEEKIPSDTWKKVKANFREFYSERDELKEHIQQIEQISLLLHVQDRDARFRLSSNTAAETAHESQSLKPLLSNPESHFASYNFPFQIIKFYFSCKEGGPPFSLIRPQNYRFIPKFLWMSANRDKVIPILSLCSFFGLLERNDLIHLDENGSWTQDLHSFMVSWPDISSKLCSIVTGAEYSSLKNSAKEELALTLFIASVSQTTTKNAFDAIQTGNRAIILYGPPGTGKTYIAQQLALRLILDKREHTETRLSTSANELKLLEESRFKDAYDEADPDPSTQVVSPVANRNGTTTSGRWAIVQFHPSYSYYDFIGGIMPSLNGSALNYTKRHGIFKRFCDAARAHLGVPFILIIDEINRADLSSVFGELLYALEYRGVEVDTLQFGRFSVPPNVYIIGTMNSADKSLVTFDLALRRRFLFMKLMPDLNTLHEWNSELPTKIDSDELKAFILNGEDLNASLLNKTEKGLGLPEDYGIGQAYFMKIRDFCATEDDDMLHITPFARERLWDYHIEPLIEEYLGAEAVSWKAKISNLRTKFTTSK
jgi:MoxR-like ATPase